MSDTLSNVILFLRSTLFALLVAIATIVWAFACFAFAPLPYRSRYYWTARWNWFVIAAAKTICGIRYQIKGAENLPDSPTILLSKHQSAWETLAYMILMPRPLVYVFKKELTRIPFFGWGISLLRMIPIDRSKGADAFQQVVAQGKQRLANGQWIVLFPEGTRIPVGKKGRYKSGGARLAIQTQTPVTPIAVNSGACWPKNAFVKRPGVITISVGPPIAPDNLSAQELMQKVENWIEAEMRVISPDAY